MTDNPIFRPLPADHGLPIAGTAARFAEAERLVPGAAPDRLAAEALPPAIREALTSLRPPFAGLSMDRPVLMGIVNVTPDSFSDGGVWFDPARAIAHGAALAGAGAGILDIGGESTRPGALAVPPEDEIARILPVLRGLAGRAVLSVDTRKAAVARAAVAAGAAIVNDVSGLDFDPDMARVVADSDAGLVVMHAQGRPETMQDDPRYDDVLAEVFDALAERVARAEAAGIPLARICVDPGIGFGKTEAHNLALIRRIGAFHGLGVPVMLGVSRKRTIGRVAGVPVAADRDPGTLALTLAAVAQGVQVHRVHNVASAAQGIALWQALGRA